MVMKGTLNGICSKYLLEIRSVQTWIFNKYPMDRISWVESQVCAFFMTAKLVFRLANKGISHESGWIKKTDTPVLSWIRPWHRRWNYFVLRSLWLNIWMKFVLRKIVADLLYIHRLPKVICIKFIFFWRILKEVTFRSFIPSTK